MNFKKTIAKSLVVAMALGMVPVANLQTAKAAAPVITFVPETGLATAGDGKFWAIAKEDAKGTVTIGTKKYKITNVQDVAGEIDVYAALKGKAGIIAVGEKSVPDDTWLIKEFKEADKTFKVQFIASAGAIKKGPKPANLANVLGGDFGYLFATDGKNPVEYDLKTNEEKVEVKLNDGNWMTFKKFFGGSASVDKDKVNKKLKALGQSGSTLSFRIAGTDSAWASKESKVKIVAQAKAPAVKVDPTKETTTIKAGIQWQIVENGAEAGATWNLATDKKALTLADLKLKTDKAYDVIVRTGATEKKIASKEGRVSLSKPADKLYTNAATEFNDGNTDIVTNKLTVKPVLAYDITKGLVLENKDTTKDIEYALVTTGVDNYKWNTLKAPKNADKPTKVTLKYSKSAKANTWIAKDSAKSTVLMVREAGKKQDKTNHVVLSGATSGAILAFTNIAQKFTFQAGSAANPAGNGDITAAANSTTAAIKVPTGTAVSFTIKAKVENAVSAKGGVPKLKAIDKLPSGVTIKAGKISGTDGTFDITVNVSNKAFKTDAINATAKYNLKYEGADADFIITFAKKS